MHHLGQCFSACRFFFRCRRRCNITVQRRCTATSVCRRLHNTLCCVKNGERKLVVGSHYCRSWLPQLSQSFTSLQLLKEWQYDKNMCLIKRRNVHPSIWGGGGGGGGGVIVYSHRIITLQSSGAVWKSSWPSWAPVPKKPTVSVDVKQRIITDFFDFFFSFPELQCFVCSLRSLLLLYVYFFLFFIHLQAIWADLNCSDNAGPR